ncbi:MAG: Recombination protein RecR [Brockia lithotrophica]|uniref:Recombination protein RecR n=1 Tax=Brockia lithotrophica TaxID=933949 RepID=A0A2T5GB66_9BACL|nr:recombination protein RecR [Brockia lithotrophica]MBT9252505.1 recombination mediator RecR [Brockia lithotrophica]PTQ53421.1 MAG: Recombination protein RecR [Brockia lithotrophica]
MERKIAVLPRSLRELMYHLQKLPGVGPKTAARLAYHILSMREEEAVGLAEAILAARRRIRECSICHAHTEDEVCPICRDPRRDPRLLMVVAWPKDVDAIEKSGVYRGRYHVLHGLLSPLEGKGPEQLRIRSLLERLKADERIDEVILALDATTEGEVTANFIARLLRDTPLTVTRLGYGLPVGGSLEFTDELTLARALEGRRKLEFSAEGPKEVKGNPDERPEERGTPRPR